MKIKPNSHRPTPNTSLLPNDLAKSMEMIRLMMMFTHGIRSKMIHQIGRPTISSNRWRYRSE
jgi:hypothetical protein